MTRLSFGGTVRVVAMAAAVALAAGTAVVATGTAANAAGPWFVSLTGNNANTCTSSVQACRTINGALAKPGFVPGDTINVAAGTYTFERPSITKAVSIVGAGAASTIINASATPAAPSSTVIVNIPPANPNQSVSISGLTITGGRAASFGGGGIALFAGNLTVTDSVVSGNVAGGFANTFGGGGIFNLGRAFSTNPTLNLTRVTVSGNQTVLSGTTPFPGGGLYTAGPTNIVDSTISGNTTQGVTSGGGVYVNRLVAHDNALLTGTGSNILANSATFGGGVMVNAAAAMSMTGGSIANNTATSGGGLYVIGRSDLVPGVSGSAALNGTSVSNNIANGAAVLNGGNGGGVLSSGDLTIAGNAQLSGNRAIASSTGGTATGWGGGIFTGPTSPGDAPATNLTDVTIAGGGHALNATAGGGIAQAGNVFSVANVTPAVLNGSRVALNGNIAVHGGGAYVGAVATLNGSTVLGNAANASGGIGGGLYIAKNPASGPNPSVILDDTDVTFNGAATGGGVGTNSNSSLVVRNSSTVATNAAVLGAGLFNAGTTTITDSAVTANASTFQGGGIWNGSTVVADQPLVVTSGATIDGNSAASAGGGVIVAARAAMLAAEGSISGNTATTGGGLYVAEGGGASLDGTTIADNTANGLFGGGVLNSGQTVVTDSLIDGNQAIISSASTGVGGGIYSGSSTAGATTRLLLERVTVSDNTAHTASAVFTRSTGAGATNTAALRNSTISGNQTAVGFAAVVPFGSMTISSSTIVDNTSPVGATGGIFAAGPTGIAGSIVSGNSGSNCQGGPITNGGHNLTDPGDTSCPFPAAAQVDPELGPLAANGGPTPTHLPEATSPAINAIPPSSATGLTDAISATPVVLCAPGAVDQRAVPRPQGPTCDIGAVEADLSAPTVDGETNPVFVTGAPASYEYTSTGVPAPALSVTGDLPDGVEFTDNGEGTGTLAGTPAEGTGGSYPVTVVADNGVAPNGTLDVTVQVDQPTAIEGPATATYTVGVPGGPTEFTTTGVPTPTLSTTSDLPDGVAFTDNGDGTATLAGTPADGEGGVYAIVIEATNGVGDPAAFDFTLTVNEAPAIDGPATETYTVGEASGPTTFTTDGFPTATLSTESDLPDGVTFTDNGDGTATLAGTPADGTGDVYEIVVVARNGIEPDASTMLTLTVDEAPEIVGPPEVRMVIGTESTIGYSADGHPVAGLSAAGSLPLGVTFTDNGNGTATLAGTPDLGSDGTYVVTVTASNGIDPDATLEVTITVVPPIEVTTTTLPDGQVGVGYGAEVEATGGVPPFTFTVVGGSLPAGLSMAADGTITGTPTGPTGTSTFMIEVTDALDPAQTDTQQLSITIGRGPTSLTVEPVLLSTTGGLIKLTIGRVSARLTGGTPPTGLGGQTVVFRAGATTVCSGVTGPTGDVTCTLSVLNTVLVILSGGVTASYAGSPLWLPSSRSAGIL